MLILIDGLNVESHYAPSLPVANLGWPATQFPRNLIHLPTNLDFKSIPHNLASSRSCHLLCVGSIKYPICVRGEHLAPPPQLQHMPSGCQDSLSCTRASGRWGVCWKWEPVFFINYYLERMIKVYLGHPTSKAHGSPQTKSGFICHKGSSVCHFKHWTLLWSCKSDKVCETFQSENLGAEQSVIYLLHNMHYKFLWLSKARVSKISGLSLELRTSIDLTWKIMWLSNH